MLTKDQANVVAEYLLANAPRALAPRVPSILRSAQSARLDRWQEWQLYQQVQHETLSGWRWNFAFVVYSLLMTAIWILFAIHPISEWRTPAFVVAIAAPIYVRLALIRRELARHAGELLNSTDRERSY